VVNQFLILHAQMAHSPAVLYAGQRRITPRWLPTGDCFSGQRFEEAIYVLYVVVDGWG
jgi:hypothetical protein